MSLKSLIWGSAAVGLASVAIYVPQIKFNKILGVSRVVEDYGMEKCKLIDGPSYCEDIALHRASGWALLSCDTSRATYNPSLNFWNETAPSTGGEIWAYKVGSDDAFRLDIQGLSTPFHPLGIAISPLDKANEADPTQLTVLVVNYPAAYSPVIEAFNVDFTSKSMSHRKTIKNEDFTQPSRLRAVRDQPGLDGLPSFYFTDSYATSPIWQKDNKYWNTWYKAVRVVEEYMTPAMSTVKYYLNRGDYVAEVGWRFSRATGIAINIDSTAPEAPASHLESPTNIFASSSYHGQLVNLRYHFLNLEYQVKTVPDPFGDVHRNVEVLAPSYLGMYEVPLEYPAESIDVDEEEKYIYSIGSPKHGDFITWAKQLKEATLKGGDTSTLLAKKPPTVISVTGSRSRSSIREDELSERARKARQDADARIGKDAPNVISDDKHNADIFQQRYFKTIPLIQSKGGYGTGAGLVLDTKRGKILASGSYESGFLECTLDYDDIKSRMTKAILAAAPKRPETASKVKSAVKSKVSSVVGKASEAADDDW